MLRFHGFLLGALLTCTSCSTWAQLYDGRTLQEAALTDMTSQVQPGSIVILGENHGMAAHRDQHLAVLQQLRAQGLKVSVGLEFINYTDQLSVDLYRSGELNDEQFLSAIKWTGFGFEFYKPQLIFPDVHNGEYSLGLNLSRTITSKISKSGLACLDEADLALLPPNFEVGRDSYKERFMAAAGAHCKVPENCFAAQSAWDDTMAWTAVNFMKAHPEQVLVIVVGEFHAQFGGGLKDRILKRWPEAQVKTLSQIWAEGLNAEEIQQELQPSTVEGPRGDFIWVSKP
jgi:uncharacterized iron-regulated protein